MGFLDLNLWEEEEERIHTCLVEALTYLLESEDINENEIEDSISGKLFPHLLRARKKFKLTPIAKRQVAIYDHETDAVPMGYPDFGFFWNDIEFNQVEYHIECKRLSILRKPHCKDYVNRGIKRYQNSIYARNELSGTMIGYVQEGDCEKILHDVNNFADKAKISKLDLLEEWKNRGVNKLIHTLNRPEEFFLSHYWVDFRQVSNLVPC